MNPYLNINLETPLFVLGFSYLGFPYSIQIYKSIVLEENWPEIGQPFFEKPILSANISNKIITRHNPNKLTSWIQVYMDTILIGEFPAQAFLSRDKGKIEWKKRLDFKGRQIFGNMAYYDLADIPPEMEISSFKEHLLYGILFTTHREQILKSVFNALSAWEPSFNSKIEFDRAISEILLNRFSPNPNTILYHGPSNTDYPDYITIDISYSIFEDMPIFAFVDSDPKTVRIFRNTTDAATEAVSSWADRMRLSFPKSQTLEYISDLEETLNQAIDMLRES